MITLTTERLLLRPFKETDTEEFYNIVQDERIKRYLPGIYSENVEEIRKQIEIYMKANFQDDFYFVLEDLKNHTIIGCLTLTRMFSNNMEISYFIAREQRGNGFMLEALNEFLHWYGKTKNKNCIIFRVSNNNAPSKRLCTKLKNAKIPMLPLANEQNYNYYLVRSYFIH